MNWYVFSKDIAGSLLYAIFMTAILRWIRRKNDSVKPEKRETITKIRRDRDALWLAFSFIYFWLLVCADQVGNLISSFGHYAMIPFVFGLATIYEGSRGLLYLWDRRHPPVKAPPDDDGSRLPDKKTTS